MTDWNEGVITDWNKVAQIELNHSDVDFNSKSRLPPIRFLRQTTYGFEA